MTKITNEHRSKISPLILALIKDDNWKELQKEKDLPEKHIIRFGNTAIHSLYRGNQLVGYIVINDIGNDLYEISGDIKNINEFLSNFHT